jgi:IclR family transcriptional regulator, KDG regulon repressor
LSAYFFSGNSLRNKLQCNVLRYEEILAIFEGNKEIEMMSEGNGQRIQSLDRGLRILEFVASRERPVKLAELAKLLEVEKSSVHRLAETLADRGYLARDPEAQGYVLHDKIFELAGKLAARRRIQECARKFLRELAQKTGETAHLAIRGHDGVVFVDHEFGNQTVAVTSQSGSSEPFHCTALGKALLAGCSEKEIQDLAGPSGFKRYNSRTITRAEKLADCGRKVLTQGWAVDDEEYRSGVRCLAAPVMDFRGRVVAAIGISGPVERMPEATMEKCGLLVKECGSKLSEELGYRR